MGGAIVDHKILAFEIERVFVENVRFDQLRERVISDHRIFWFAVNGQFNGADRAHLHALAAEDTLILVNIDGLFLTMRPFSSTASTCVMASRADFGADLAATQRSGQVIK